MINLFYNNYKTNQYVNNVIEKKINNTIYFKYFIKNSEIVDAFYFNQGITNCQLGIGFSTYANLYFYKNKFNKNIKFFFIKNKQYNFYLNNNTKDFLNKIILNKKLFLLKPIKNGIQVYSTGIIGILSIIDFYNLIISNLNSFIFFDILKDYLLLLSNENKLIKFNTNIKKLSFNLFFLKGVYSKNKHRPKKKKRAIFIFKFDKINANTKEIKKNYFEKRDRKLKVYNIKTSQFFKQNKSKDYKKK